MEVKINREIREYTESMFFGLTLRQFIFTVLAAAASIISYFLLRPVIGIEAVSWVCMLTAVPFAVLGFVRYNGMPAEKFIWAWIKSEILMPKHLCFGNSNLYMELLSGAERDKQRQKKKRKRRKRRK
ncbi:MAG: PrgI family protein [Anaerovoracaceae bacterium]|uniref:PrgI family protein n=1 Tax=Hornefia butyriciproducens TaxID=2652293 RepID=UPI003D01F796